MDKLMKIPYLGYVKMDMLKNSTPTRLARHGKGIQRGDAADGGLCGKTCGSFLRLTCMTVYDWRKRS
jgi:hypothetical protein